MKNSYNDKLLSYVVYVCGVSNGVDERCEIMKTPHDYDELLEIGGAKIISYKQFGSYQGDWIAKIEYNGKVGYIKDYFGSCTGCDALQAEFGYTDDVPHQKVLNFALAYLNDIQDYDTILKSASENTSWDLDADEMVKWLESIKEKVI